MSPHLNSAHPQLYNIFIYTFFLSLFVAQNVFSQNRKVVDSLRTELAKSEGNLAKAKIYNLLAFEFISVDSLEAITYGKKAIELSQSSGYQKGVANAWYFIGTIYRIRGYNNEAEQWYSKSRNLSDSLSLSKEYARSTLALGTIYSLNGERSQSLEFYKETLAIYQKLEDQEGLAKTYTELGIDSKNAANYDNAIDYYEKALAINLELDKASSVLKNYNNLANVYINIGDFAKSIALHLKSIGIAIDLGDKNSEAVGYSNIGQLYVQQGDFNKALEYFNNGFRLAEDIGNLEEVALVKVKIGNAYIYQGKATEALKLFKESAAIAKQLRSKRLEANAFNSIGDVYYRSEDHSNALKYFELTRQIYLELGNRDQLSHLLIYMGDVYRRAGQFQKAREYLNEGAKLAQEINYAIALRDAKLLLSYVEHDDGNHEASFWSHVEYKEVFDSLRNDDMTKNIARLEAEFEFQQERDSIAFEQNLANLAYEEKLQRNQVIIQAAIGGGVLVITILIILYRSFLIKQKKNSELRHKNEVIELKNNELSAKNNEISDLRETEKKMSEETLSLKERELTTVTMLSHEKNALLEQLGNQIGHLSAKVDEDVIPELKEIKRTIKTNLSEESWSMFMYQFEKVHPDFFKILKNNHPNLTPHDLRLCAYLKVGMDNKEIAQVSNITTDSVKKSINRMKKKIELSPESDLRDFLIRL
jgi:tetratricopeptide (TPR) repeat protein